MDAGSCNAGTIAPDGQWQNLKRFYNTLVFINLY